MAVYNTPGNYLRESIESILNQTYSNFEFIIINDGSNNYETCNMLQEYEKKDERIKIIRNRSNIGLTKSLNIGLTIAKGKYIARMDADDIAMPTRFEEQVIYMNNHEDVVVLGTQVEKFGEKQEKEPMYFIDYTQGDYQEFLINMMFCNVANIHPTVMIRHEFLKSNDIKYDENIKKAQDYKLWIDCISHGGRIYNLPSVLLKYRVHEDQITSKNYDEQHKYIRSISKYTIKTYGFLLRNEEYQLILDLYSSVYVTRPQEYIKTIIKMIIINKEKHIFDNKVFAEVLKVRWLHKVFKCTVKGKSIRGWCCLYTWRCVFSKAMFKWIKMHLIRR